MRLFPLLFLTLAACDSPSIAVQGTPAQQVALGGHVFSVRTRGDYAEAARLNTVWPPPTPAEVVPLALAAMEQATGCRVRMSSVKGDAAMQTATLDC